MSEPGPTFASLTADDHVTGEAVALDLPPASLGARIVSGLIDVLLTLAVLVVAILVLGIAALQSDGALAHVALIGTLIARLPGAAHDGGDAHPRPLARQAGDGVCARCATTPGRSPCSTPSCGPSSGSSRSTSSPGCRRSSPPCSRPRASGSGTTPPARTSCASRVRLQLAPPALMPPELAPVGPHRRHGRPADRAGPGRAPVPRPRRPRSTRRTATRWGSASPTWWRPTSPRRPRPAPRRRTTSPRSIASRRERDLVRLRRDAALRDRLTARR